VTRRLFAAASSAAAVASAAEPLTAKQVIEKIRQNLGVAWREPTVDTIKAGNPDAPVKGIATTVMATLDVLQRAAARGRNLVITHEPTFYNHEDKTQEFENDLVYQAKQALIAKHNMVVFRFHDNWHARRPDRMLTRLAEVMGFQPANGTNPRLFEIPATSLDQLARDIQSRMKIRAMRVVGKPGTRISRVVVNPGYANMMGPVRALAQADLFIAGEAREWEGVEWTPEREAEIVEYLGSRRRGGRDWIVFHNTRPVEDLRQAAPELRTIALDRPIIGLLTNVAWDAQLHYPANAFPDMLEWIVRTVRWFADRPELQLLIRVHPAELSGDIPSRQLVVDELRRAFPTLPSNVFVVPPESAMSTYAAAEACDAVIIFGTKTGVELTSLGIPVIVAGEAWIRNKGLTTDASSNEDYFRILSRLPLRARMPEAMTRRARQYAYHFFFRRMIPIDQVEPTGGQPQFRLAIRTVDELAAGRSVGLDVICDGILRGTPFVYPAERLEAGPR